MRGAVLGLLKAGSGPEGGGRVGGEVGGSGRNGRGKSVIREYCMDFFFQKKNLILYLAMESLRDTL